MKTKMKDGEKLNLYVDKKIKRSLAQMAQSNHRSISQQVEDMVRRENAKISSGQASDTATALIPSAVEVSRGIPKRKPKHEAGAPIVQKHSRGHDAVRGSSRLPEPRGAVPTEQQDEK